MNAPLTPERWSAVQDHFHDLLALDELARIEALARIGVIDATLAEEVRSLLAAEADGVLSRGLDVPCAVSRSSQVGPYRLIRPLGEGGMGAVFLAERAGEGFDQRVALKLVRPGLLDPRLGSHAEHERRVLARLEHPNIARLIDGGTTPEGQPYLAMEYVEGTTLLAHAEEQGLSAKARVGLLVEICEAVHHAHLQLVIHRDLKPSNVMVGKDGRPRLLDFGIAKLLDREMSGTGLSQSAPWLTPSYASPEQVRGEPIGMYSDVYSLGVIAYELLAQTRPYRLDGRTPAECERLICETDPPKPSAVAADARARAALRGDLDTIVLKALAKQPARRYGSGKDLADDLRRYLDGRPVRAQSAGLAYRVRKFVRRNRAATALGGLATLLLLGGVAGVARQAEIARRERDRSEEARRTAEQVTTYLTGLFDTEGSLDGAQDTTIARALLREGVRQADALAAQPLLQARMYDALGMVFVRLQRFDEAGRLVERARAERERRLSSGHPDRAESDAHLARIRRAQSRYAEAQVLAERALRVRSAAFGPWHPSVAESNRDLALLMPYLGRDAEARVFAERALAIDQREYGDSHPTTIEDRVLLAQVLRRIGEKSRSLALLDSVLVTQVRLLGPDNPQLSHTRFLIADLTRDQGDLAAAESTYRDALERHRRATSDGDLGLMHGLGNLADLLGEQGRETEAEPLLRKAIDIQTRHFGARSLGVAEATEALASSMTRQNRLDEALRLRRQGLETWRAALGNEHAAVAGSLAALASLLRRMERLDEAEQVAREALAMRGRLLGDAHPLVALSRLPLAEVLLARRRFQAANEEAVKALRILETTRPSDHPDLREAQRVMALVIDSLDRAGRQ